jgi:hypothetical protein
MAYPQSGEQRAALGPFGKRLATGHTRLFDKLVHGQAGHLSGGADLAALGVEARSIIGGLFGRGNASVTINGHL